MFPELTRIRIPWKIRELEDTYGIHILHAAENGSRAWGTASKDSDFDVRFVYEETNTCVWMRPGILWSCRFRMAGI